MKQAGIFILAILVVGASHDQQEGSNESKIISKQEGFYVRETGRITLMTGWETGNTIVKIEHPPMPKLNAACDVGNIIILSGKGKSLHTMDLTYLLNRYIKDRQYLLKEFIKDNLGTPLRKKRARALWANVGNFLYTSIFRGYLVG